MWTNRHLRSLLLLLVLLLVARARSADASSLLGGEASLLQRAGGGAASAWSALLRAVLGRNSDKAAGPAPAPRRFGPSSGDDLQLLDAPSVRASPELFDEGDMIKVGARAVVSAQAARPPRALLLPPGGLEMQNQFPIAGDVVGRALADRL